MLDLIITRLNGARLSLADAGITLRDFVIDSPELIVEYEDLPGRPGALEMGAQYGKRYMAGDFYAKAADEIDFHAMRNEIFRLFNSEEPFYITEACEPGKRWLVRTEGRYNLDRQRTYGFFAVNFVSASPFAESIVRTSENEFRFDSSRLQFGQGIVTEPLIYRFTTTSFRVYNAGSVPVDWRSAGATLTYRGASNGLRIRNVTTGADWRYTGASNSGDTIRLEERARSTKNGLTIFGATNMASMVLAPGWNEFEIIGNGGSFEVTFDFRFLYL